MAAPAIGRGSRVPAGGVIDRGHPLGAGLAFWTNPRTLVDLVNGYQGAASGAVDFADEGVSFTSQTAQINYGTGPLLPTGSTWTAAALIDVAPGAGSNKVILCKRSAFGAGTNDFTFAIDGANGAVVSAGTAVGIPGVTLAADVAVYVITCTSTTVTAYLNGRFAASTAADCRSSTSSSAPIGVGQLITEGSQGFTPGVIRWAALWSRALSAAEVALLQNDPYGFIRG